jgi:hypothetical protein
VHISLFTFRGVNGHGVPEEFHRAPAVALMRVMSDGDCKVIRSHTQCHLLLEGLSS